MLNEICLHDAGCKSLKVNHHFLRAKPEVAERTVIACMRQDSLHGLCQRAILWHA